MKHWRKIIGAKIKLRREAQGDETEAHKTEARAQT